MKKFSFILCAAFVFFLVLSFSYRPASGIHGTIDPPKAAKTVRAISGTDSVSAVPAEGMFSIALKPGSWKLVVEGIPPYQNKTIENIAVNEGQSTDVGAITLMAE